MDSTENFIGDLATTGTNGDWKVAVARIVVGGGAENVFSGVDDVEPEVELAPEVEVVLPVGEDGI